MLQSFRDQSGKWFTKVLFGAIIASFVVWGIGDVVRSYIHNRPIAKVGKESISYEHYASAFQQEISRIQQALKSRLTPDQIQHLNIRQHVLDQLINQSALEQEFARSKLKVSDSLVRLYIHSIGAFQEKGTFSRRLFEDLLQHNNLREAHFINEVRYSLLSQQLMSPLIMGMRLPQFYQDLLFKILTEKKKFAVVHLPFSKVTLKQKAITEDLKLFYDQNKDRYFVPEFRSISLLLIENKNLLTRIDVSEEEIRQEYEKYPSQFTKPERRDVKSITYATEEQALQGAKLLNLGQLIAVVAKKTGGNFEDLGLVEKSSLGEISADTVYGLALHKVSEVINTGFGYVIYQVTKIEPEALQDFSEVRSQIKENLRMQRIGDYSHQLKNRVEDKVAAGETFEGIAKSEGLRFEKLSPFMQKNKDRKGKSILPFLPSEVTKQVVEQTFSLNEGEESSVVEVTPEYSIVIKVDSIEPGYTPEFKSVRPIVEKDWVSEKLFEEASQLAHTITQQAKNQQDLVRLSKQYGLIVDSDQSLSRHDLILTENGEKKPKSLQNLADVELLSKALQTAFNQAVYGVGLEEKSFVILMPIGTQPDVLDDQQEKKFKESLKSMVERDAVSLLTECFRGRLKITINQDLLNIVAQETH